PRPRRSGRQGRGRAGRGRRRRWSVERRRSGDGGLSRARRRPAVGLLLIAQAFFWGPPTLASAASAAVRPGRSALIAFVEAGEQELASCGLSAAAMSSAQGTYSRDQLLLDVG